MGRQLLELLAKVHGVQFDEKTTDEELQKQLTEAISASGEGGTTPPPTPTPPANAPTNPHLTPALLAEMKKQGEENALIARLVAAYEDTQSQVAALTASNRLSEVRRKLSDIGESRRALTPHVSQKLSELVAAMPPKAGDAVLDVVKEILGDGGTIELGERGRSAIDNGKDAAQRFEGAVQKLMEADKNLDYADAVTAVAAAHPDLFEGYRASATMDRR